MTLGSKIFLGILVLVVTGQDKNGKTSSKIYTVIRFGVQHRNGSPPFMTGLESGTFTGTWQLMRNGKQALHVDGASNGGVYIHAGPADTRFPVGAIKCIELCGPGSWTGFNSFIDSLGGKTVPINITIEQAVTPSLKEKGTYELN